MVNNMAVSTEYFIIFHAGAQFARTIEQDEWNWKRAMRRLSSLDIK